MKEHDDQINKDERDKDDQIDKDLVDHNWEPTPEDFIVEKKDVNKEPTQRKKWVRFATIGIAVLLVFQVVAVFFSTYSIDAIRFLKTSYQLSQQEDVQMYKEAVVTIQGERSRGTGFAISADGLIVTNHHVIADQLKIMVAFHEGELFEGKLIHSDPELDIAFLQVDGNGLPFLPLSETNGDISEKIYVIGNPLTWTQIANVGEILDTKERTIISAPIYRGNSGSPVINTKGEVVAVVFALQRTTQYGGKSVGLAVPIEKVIEILPAN